MAEKPWIWYQNIIPDPKDGTNSVKIVQRALNSEVNAGLKVDGIFGRLSKAAYAKWQRKLNYSGDAADGNPGKTSLTKLADAAGFDIHYPKPEPATTSDNYEKAKEPAQDHTRVYWGGRTVNKRTAVLLDRAKSIYGKNFTLTQGSYNTGVAASAGTHDKGGVVDVNVSGMSVAEMYRLQLALRKAGFAAWVRTPAQGFAYHIHAVDVGNNDTAYLARDQVQSYFNGRNGLASNGRDTTEHRWPDWADRYNH